MKTILSNVEQHVINRISKWELWHAQEFTKLIISASWKLKKSNQPLPPNFRMLKLKNIITPMYSEVVHNFKYFTNVNQKCSIIKYMIWRWRNILSQIGLIPPIWTLIGSFSIYVVGVFQLWSLPLFSFYKGDIQGIAFNIGSQHLEFIQFIILRKYWLHRIRLR